MSYQQLQNALEINNQVIKSAMDLIVELREELRKARNLKRPRERSVSFLDHPSPSKKAKTMTHDESTDDDYDPTVEASETTDDDEDEPEYDELEEETLQKVDVTPLPKPRQKKQRCIQQDKEKLPPFVYRKLFEQDLKTAYEQTVACWSNLETGIEDMRNHWKKMPLKAEEKYRHTTPSNKRKTWLAMCTLFIDKNGVKDKAKLSDFPTELMGKTTFISNVCSYRKPTYIGGAQSWRVWSKGRHLRLTDDKQNVVLAWK